VCLALLEKQRPADALAVAGLNADEYPSHGLAFARRGQAEAATGDVEAARASFLRALELSPNDALARQGLAALESAGGK